MIIANPIYDVTFRYLMEDLDIAKGVISRIIQQEVESLQFSAQEGTIPKGQAFLTVYRMDFVAQIRTADGSNRKVLIEIQKAKLSSDVSRFREYLGKQYMSREEVTDPDGSTRKTSLPIVTIYILGFTLSETLPSSIKIKREYLDALTGERLAERSTFIEALTHDAFVVQVPKLTASMQTELERTLSIFRQTRFVDDDHHELDYLPEVGSDDLLARIVRRLHKARVNQALRQRMELEDQLYAETLAAIEEQTASLTQRLKLTKSQLAEVAVLKQAAETREAEATAREEQAKNQAALERQAKEEAKASAAEARAREEQAKASAADLTAKAVKALVEQMGISEQQARKLLGLE